MLYILNYLALKTAASRDNPEKPFKAVSQRPFHLTGFFREVAPSHSSI
jgi:hypothetical protein